MQTTGGEETKKNGGNLRYRSSDTILKFGRAFDEGNHIYSNKNETSNFHGTVYFDSVKLSQQK